LSTLDKVRLVARKILRSSECGRPVVIVVSAMGNTTSELIERARQVSLSPPRRELDVLLSSGERMSTALLAMALQELGSSAISLTGPQGGILTDDQHTSASIVDVRPGRVAKELASGKIVIVAGFQGLSPIGEVTTLGRGGSDTTAVALAGALDAERCEIYSDVPGVYTADPRIVDEPVHLKQIDSELMREYALHGARVLHPACIDLARQSGVAIHAGSTFGEERFTRIGCEASLAFTEHAHEKPSIAGVTSRKSRVHVRGRSSNSATMFERAVDCLDEYDGLLRQLSGASEDLLVDIEDVPDPERVSALLRERLQGVATVTEELASVSIVTQPTVTRELVGRVETNLARSGIGASSIYRRPHSVTCAVERADRTRSVRALHTCLVEDSLAVGA
jgi:aspartate kinase